VNVRATAADAVAVIERSRLPGLGLLFDTYHLANNGDDLIAVVDRYGPRIAHVQLADSPGRGEPGTGDLPLAAAVDRLWSAGYRGAVACEYSPSGPTAGTLGWIAHMPHVTLR
jgi:hydroxypyruvate isomerase